MWGCCRITRAVPQNRDISVSQKCDTHDQREVAVQMHANEGSGIISVNGVSAHRAEPGDIVIICA
ncbi:MAG: aspartate 1-decarboxylase [Rudaea sp.]